MSTPQRQKIDSNYELPPESTKDADYYNSTVFEFEYHKGMSTFYRWLIDLAPRRRNLVKYISFDTGVEPSQSYAAPTPPSESPTKRALRRLQEIRAYMQECGLTLDYAVLEIDTGEADVETYVTNGPVCDTWRRG